MQANLALEMLFDYENAHRGAVVLSHAEHHAAALHLQRGVSPGRSLGGQRVSPRVWFVALGTRLGVRVTPRAAGSS